MLETAYLLQLQFFIISHLLNRVKVLIWQLNTASSIYQCNYINFNFGSQLENHNLIGEPAYK